ncbi:alcohol oxidase [Ascobolus immersus RN42]|uniref:Alcohol oxidase n=1 Tax=Ascobolus immersus RN42 TaxID=1160509 RepID=A0A3N4HV15_ASCIM|nr:alcohol oxidase [Ascobolus immersus RN42]
MKIRLRLLSVILAISSDSAAVALLSPTGVIASIGSLFGVGQTYDYVIVGGGTAGLAIAARLSENPDITVAVIEAGGKYELTNPLLSTTPAGDVIFAGSDKNDTNPLVDWGFITAPQAGAADRKVKYARGKCLGGSSARHFMVYQRGTRDSYQKWADLVDDQSYTFDNLLPYFKKSVKFTAPNTAKRFANATTLYDVDAFDTTGGPVAVSYANYAQPFSTWMQPALNEIGVGTTDDFNSGSLMGCQYCSSTIDPTRQTRESSQTSYLEEAKKRSNLKVYDFTLAKQILFNAAKKATGVKVSSDKGITSYTVTARKEVIVSAGVFQSPQLLMVSGIGPKADLERLKIKVLAERPGVGQGMQDHIFAGPSYRVKVPTLTRLATDPLYVLWEYANEYSLRKQGPLTNPVCDFLGWEKTPRSLLGPAHVRELDNSFPKDWPEIEYISGAGYIGDFGNLFKDQPKDGFQYATILASLVAPLSRGNVTIISKDTKDLPVINPNWLTHPTDAAVMLAAYKRARAAFATKAMQDVLVNPGKEYYPGPSVRTDAEIMKVIRETVMTIWHASCTCRMGKKDDIMAVVDSEAKVIGVDGLRVVDASSFALLPPGHPQSTVYALAEKIADNILKGLKA